MKVTFAKHNIRDMYYEDIPPKYMLYLDYYIHVPSPSRGMARKGKALRRMDLPDVLHYHELNITIGAGKYGVSIEVRYKPFKFKEIEVVEEHKQTGELTIGFKVIKEYL